MKSVQNFGAVLVGLAHLTTQIPVRLCGIIAVTKWCYQSGDTVSQTTLPEIRNASSTCDLADLTISNVVDCLNSYVKRIEGHGMKQLVEQKLTL
jgi:hypothetical protein